MNKIYKLKKNKLSQLVVCSELAKSVTKGSLVALMVGLGATQSVLADTPLIYKNTNGVGINYYGEGGITTNAALSLDSHAVNGINNILIGANSLAAGQGNLLGIGVNSSINSLVVWKKYKEDLYKTRDVVTPSITTNFIKSLGVDIHSDDVKKSVNGINSVALGSFNLINGANSYAIGNDNGIFVPKNILERVASSGSLGSANLSFGNANHNRGTLNTAYGDFISISGSLNDVAGNDSHVFGNKNTVAGTRSGAVGLRNVVVALSKDTAESILNDSSDQSIHNILFNDTKGYAHKIFNTKEIKPSELTNSEKVKDSYAFGVDNIIVAEKDYALGHSNKIIANNSIAIGHNNTIGADANNVYVLGSGISVNGATHAGDVILGKDSATADEVSVSRTYVGQLADFAGHTPVGTVSVGAASKERQIKNVAAGQINANSTDAVNGSQLFQLVELIKNAPADTKMITLTLTDSSGKNKIYKLSGKNALSVMGDTNIQTVVSDLGIKVKLNKNLVLGNLGSIQVAGITLNKNNADFGKKRITNVSNGQVNKNSKDVVNGGQLYELEQRMLKLIDKLK